jgi:hypothetical protein
MSNIGLKIMTTLHFAIYLLIALCMLDCLASTTLPFMCLGFAYYLVIAKTHFLRNLTQKITFYFITSSVVLLYMINSQDFLA